MAADGFQYCPLIDLPQDGEKEAFVYATQVVSKCNIAIDSVNDHEDRIQELEKRKGGGGGAEQQGGPILFEFSIGNGDFVSYQIPALLVGNEDG